MLTKYSVILLVLVLCVVQISSWKVWLRKSGAVIGAIVISQLTALPTNALTDPASMERFEAAQAELVNLDKNWDAIVQKQGDNVRRKLGTVYTPPICSSPLCSFPSFVNKFVQAHPDDLDISSFEEPISVVLQSLNQADFLAYSSVFSEYGNGGAGVDYIANSRVQIQKAIEGMNEVIKVLKE